MAKNKRSSAKKPQNRKRKSKEPDVDDDVDGAQEDAESAPSNEGHSTPTKKLASLELRSQVAQVRGICHFPGDIDVIPKPSTSTSTWEPGSQVHLGGAGLRVIKYLDPPILRGVSARPIFSLVGEGYKAAKTYSETTFGSCPYLSPLPVPGSKVPGGTWEMGRSAVKWVRVGGRTAIKSYSRAEVGPSQATEADIYGLDAPPSSYHQDEPVVPRSDLALDGEPLREGMAAHFAAVRGPVAFAASNRAGQSDSDLDQILTADTRYPLPSYKNSSLVILDSFRPVPKKPTSAAKLAIQQLKLDKIDAEAAADALANPGIQRKPKKKQKPQIVNTDPYVLVNENPTQLSELAAWFAMNRYNWSPDSYDHCKAVVSKHLGPSGDQRHNPAVRRPMFQWNPLVPKKVREKWASTGRPSAPVGVKEVFRANYSCDQSCKRDAVGANAGGRMLHANVTEPGDEEICQTKLKVIVRANLLDHAYIYQRGNHQGRRVQIKYLHHAGLLRAHARDLAERIGTTVASVWQELASLTLTWERDSYFKLPEWRKITEDDVKAIFRAQGVRNTRLGDSLMGLELLSESRRWDPAVLGDGTERGFVLYVATRVRGNPSAYESAPIIISFMPYQAPIEDDEDTQALLAVLASGASCDDMIRWSRQNGCGLDSSHRHKNENRAPMTIICTMGRTGHMLIGPSALSSDVTSETLLQFLRQSAEAIEARAIVVVQAHRNGTPIGKNATDRTHLLVEARFIVKDGFRPSHVMIDKARWELNALNAWALESGGTWIIRLCQFHIVQSILRWDTDDHSKKTTRPKKKDIKIERAAKVEIMDYFRVLQRYRVVLGPDESMDDYEERVEAEWVEAVTIFNDGMAVLAFHYADEEHVQEWYDKVVDYFEDNWFVVEWRDLWVDHGMPAGQTRDGFWGQNNRTERMFKFFDDVILRGVRNRRLDHLALIILDTFYAYFREYESSSTKMDESMFEALDQGAELWEHGLFERDPRFERAFWTTRCVVSSSSLTKWPYVLRSCIQDWRYKDVQPQPLERHLQLLRMDTNRETVRSHVGSRLPDRQWPLRRDQWCVYSGLLDRTFANLLPGDLRLSAIGGRKSGAPPRSDILPPPEPGRWIELLDSTVSEMTTEVMARTVAPRRRKWTKEPLLVATHQRAYLANAPRPRKLPRKPRLLGLPPGPSDMESVENVSGEDSSDSEDARVDSAVAAEGDDDSGDDTENSEEELTRMRAEEEEQQELEWEVAFRAQEEADEPLHQGAVAPRRFQDFEQEKSVEPTAEEEEEEIYSFLREVVADASGDTLDIVGCQEVVEVNDFIADPVIRGRPAKTAPLFPHRSGRGPPSRLPREPTARTPPVPESPSDVIARLAANEARNTIATGVPRVTFKVGISLLSAGAEAGVDKVFKLRHAHPSEIKPRPTGKKHTVMFQKAPGRKKAEKARKSLVTRDEKKAINATKKRRAAVKQAFAIASGTLTLADCVPPSQVRLSKGAPQRFPLEMMATFDDERGEPFAEVPTGAVSASPRVKQGALPRPPSSIIIEEVLCFVLAQPPTSGSNSFIDLTNLPDGTPSPQMPPKDAMFFACFAPTDPASRNNLVEDFLSEFADVVSAANLDEELPHVAPFPEGGGPAFGLARARHDRCRYRGFELLDGVEVGYDKVVPECIRPPTTMDQHSGGFRVHSEPRGKRAWGLGSLLREGVLTSRGHSQVVMSGTRYIIAPYNVRNTHWICIVADHAATTFRVFDSLASSPRSEASARLGIKVRRRSCYVIEWLHSLTTAPAASTQHLQMFFKLRIRHTKDLLGNVDEPAVPYEEWHTITKSEAGYPQQLDGSACGVYVFFCALTFVTRAIDGIFAPVMFFDWGRGADLRSRATWDVERDRMRRILLETVLHMRFYRDARIRPPILFVDRTRTKHRSPERKTLVTTKEKDTTESSRSGDEQTGFLGGLQSAHIVVGQYKSQVTDKYSSSTAETPVTSQGSPSRLANDAVASERLGGSQPEVLAGEQGADDVRHDDEVPEPSGLETILQPVPGPPACASLAVPGPPACTSLKSCPPASVDSHLPGFSLSVEAKSVAQRPASVPAVGLDPQKSSSLRANDRIPNAKRLAVSFSPSTKFYSTSAASNTGADGTQRARAPTESRRKRPRGGAKSVNMEGGPASSIVSSPDRQFAYLKYQKSKAHAKAAQNAKKKARQLRAKERTDTGTFGGGVMDESD
ncbi:hypothetical protein P7C70_g4169, partial [Phenoliferia sp. Uapishka_3]